MPAVSDKQRKVAAIAEHNPSALFEKNKGMAKMSKGQLHDFAATKAPNFGASKAKEEEAPPTKRGFGADKRSHHGRRAKPRGV